MGKADVVSGGYYLERIESKVGTGDTAKSAVMENYWQAEVLPDGRIKMTLLDIHDQTSGYYEMVDPDEIGTRFIYVPNFQPRKHNPQKDQAEKLAARAERHLERKEYLSAEFEFNNALKLDDENVRANFGLGRTYLATGEVEKAKEAFRKLARLDEVMDPRFKHIFNECGIHLRKLGMYKEAVQYYRRALALENEDEHLWFNLGRALFEGGDNQKAAKALKRALQLNPQLKEAKVLLSTIGAM
jgi:tetratricopeptide (TPR) repeat protein